MRTSTRYSLAAVMLSVLLAGGAFAQSSVRRSNNSGTTGNSSSTTTQQVRRGTTTTSSEKKENAAVQNQNTRTTNQNARTTNQSGSTSVRRSNGSTATRTTEQDTKNTSTRTTTDNNNRSTSTTTTQQNTRTSSSTRTTVAGSQSATRTGSTEQATRTTTGRTGSTEQTDQTTQNQTSVNVTRRGLSSVSSGSTTSATRTSNQVSASEYRVHNNNVERISPRERGYQSYNTPKSFYSHDSHYYGWKVHSMPPRPKRVRYYGIDYYLHNDVYYRIYGSDYIVCRPPVGVVITKTVKTPFGRVTFSYYTNTYRTYRGWDSYSRYIDEQNRIIAQNNAYIAAQNRTIAMNLNHAQTSYELAYKLGLAQSYAYANWDYYYDDGVFYIINRNGRYEVIVPPAGALVDELPDDYETIYLGGMELYRVDDTIYRTVLVSGRPYLEVLGQMYGTLASQYSIYR